MFRGPSGGAAVPVTSPPARSDPPCAAPVGNPLADLHLEDPFHRVGDALQMLDVDGSDDVDVGTQERHHILPALLVAAGARDVGVGQLVHQDHLRPR